MCGSSTRRGFPLCINHRRHSPSISVFPSFSPTAPWISSSDTTQFLFFTSNFPFPVLSHDHCVETQSHKQPISMKEASDPQSQSHGDTHRSSRRPAISPISPTSASVSGPQSLAPAASAAPSNGGNTASSPRHNTKGRRDGGGPSSSSSGTGAVNTSQAAQPGSLVAGTEEKQNVEQEKKSVAQRFWKNFKAVLLSSKVNVLLVFVPVGIAVAQIHSIPPGVIFAMNAIAIVPLAGLLSYATESVAHRLGDSLGALLNVTFGNAVELIIL